MRLTDPRPSYLAAALSAALVFALYLLTLAPSTAMWDTSEYITAAYVLGIPHPPGNPLFVLVGRVFAMLPIAPAVATRINVLAALCSALAAGMWFLVTERVLAGWLAERSQRVVGGTAAALIGATAFTVWNQSVVNEKVYTVSLLFLAIVSWLMVRWCDDPNGPRRDSLLILIAYLIGLGYSNHPAGFLVAPAVCAAVLARRARTLLRWRLLGRAVLAIALGITPFAVEPVRAAHFPPINEGEPTACTTRIHWSCTFDGVTYKRLLANINRDQYGKPPLGERQAPYSTQLGMWLLYFRWQWLRDAHGDHPLVQAALGAAFLLLGGLGGYAHWRRDRRSFWFFGSLIFTVTFALIYYMNFKYGASQAPELGATVAREVRDRDYFYLWSYSAWSVWTALGLVCVWQWLATAITPGAPRGLGGRPQTAPRSRRRGLLLASPVFLLALVPLAGNWRQASRAGDTTTRDFARDLLDSAEPYGIVITSGDNDTFPLWYAQEVEGVRRDVTVAITELLNTDWYTRQLIRRPIYEYDAAHGPAIYRAASWRKPSGPLLRLTMEQADAVPYFVPLSEPQRFTVGSLSATVDPRRLSAGGLQRSDLLVLAMIREANDSGRPMYFSRTAGDYAERLGLGAYTITQGLARKLSYAPPVAGRDTVLVPDAGYVDVPRSLALWNGFGAPRAMIRRGDWVDWPSINVPFTYVITGLTIGQALAIRGDTLSASRVFATARAVARAVRLSAEQ